MPLTLHHLLLYSNPDWFNLSGVGLPRLSWKRGDSVENLTWHKFLPNPNALVAVSSGMWAVKLCSSKILQFLTLGAG